MYKDTTQRLVIDVAQKTLVGTSINVWSHDKNSFRINMEFTNNGCPVNFTDAVLRLLLKFKDNKVRILTVEVESSIQGLAYVIIPPEILGYEGRVSAYTYIDYPDRSFDSGGFTFSMSKSEIDGPFEGMDELYIHQFEEALKKFDEIEEKIIENDLVTHPELANRISEVNADLTTISSTMEKTEIELKKDISNLEKSKADGKFTNEQLSDLQLKKVDRDYFDLIIASLGTGGPREVFYSVQALKSRYPNGEKGTFLVFDALFPNSAHAFIWNGTLWEDLGPYQAIELADGIVTEPKLAPKSVSRAKMIEIAIQNKHIANFAVSALQADFLRLSYENVYKKEDNVLGSLLVSNGMDSNIPNYWRTTYYYVEGVKRVTFVDTSKKWTSQYVFVYKEKDKAGTLLTNPEKVETETAWEYTYWLPEGFSYLRTLVRGGIYDVRDSLSIILSNTPVEYNIRQNSDILKNENIEKYFLTQDQVKLSNENIYNFTKSEMGGLDDFGLDAAYRTYSRSSYVKIHPGKTYYYYRTNLLPIHGQFCFVYTEKGLAGQSINSIGAVLLQDIKAFKFTVPEGCKYLRFVDSSPTSSPSLMPGFSIVEKTDEPPSVFVKGQNLDELYYKKSEPIPFLPFLPRPSNGIVNFNVDINENVAGMRGVDSVIASTDDGILFLPTNYEPGGKPIPLVISCHGAGTTIGSTTTSLAAPVEFLVKMGYAVMDMNGIPKNLSGGYGLHFGSPFTLQCYLKGYEFVTKQYNLKKEVFVVGTSMGGLSSMMLVQSGSIPVIAQGGFCPVTDHFKQAFCRPWTTPTTQRSKIAKFFAFEGSEPTWTSNSYPSQPEIDFYFANIDKVIGYNPMMKNVFNWYEVQPYQFLNPETIENAQEKNAYEKLVKSHPVPLKIWHNDDDTTVLPRYSKYLVDSIKNSGGLAYLRTFPTGGHNAWDNGPSVTVKGIDGNDLTIGTSGYELELWFRRFR